MKGLAVKPKVLRFLYRPCHLSASRPPLPSFTRPSKPRALEQWCKSRAEREKEMFENSKTCQTPAEASDRGRSPFHSTKCESVGYFK